VASARADDEHLHAASGRLLDETLYARRRPVRRRDRHLARNAELAERVDRGLHDRRVGGGTHEDEDFDHC